MYLGVAVVIGSLGALILVIFGAIALLIYIKAFEEKEMISRFGNDYLEYKEQTPFLIPRFGKQKK
jgi:protein-S-isoprenylcysteine O-methyltransferase Ste14